MSTMIFDVDREDQLKLEIDNWAYEYELLDAKLNSTIEIVKELHGIVKRMSDRISQLEKNTTASRVFLNLEEEEKTKALEHQMRDTLVQKALSIGIDPASFIKGYPYGSI